ncbi:MAG: site-specific integrase [Betaproteobacteria bacterium]
MKQELIVYLDFEKDGLLKSVRTEATPEEADAANRIVPALIKAARDPVPADPVKANGNGPRLFEQIDKYLAEGSATWTAQSALDIKGDFAQFKSILGDMPVAELGHEPFNRLRDTLLQLPANINKLAQTKGKPIEEILTLGLPPQSANTVKKKWGRLITFCTWLEGRGLIDRNYAQGKKPKAKAQRYEKFTKADLCALFESAEYRSGTFAEAFKYWLPLLGLYTGARLEELAQLHLADIKHNPETGILVFDITTDLDGESGAATVKNLKTEGSDRVCPVHPALVEAGLLRYVDELKAGGYDRLFPELTLDSVGKVGPRASEWFTEYRRSKSVGDLTGRSRKVFHSFRHTMNATLQKAGITQEIREALSGHVSKSINTRIYGDRLLLQVLRESLEKLDYGLALHPFVSRAEHEAARKRAVRRTAT